MNLNGGGEMVGSLRMGSREEKRLLPTVHS